MSERELFIQNYIKYVNNQADFTILNETENTFYDDAVDEAWVMWQLSVNRQGYKLVPLQPNNKTIVSIERIVENQIEASGITQDPFRLDGEKIYKAMIGAVE